MVLLLIVWLQRPVPKPTEKNISIIELSELPQGKLSGSEGDVAEKRKSTKPKARARRSAKGAASPAKKLALKDLGFKYFANGDYGAPPEGDSPEGSGNQASSDNPYGIGTRPGNDDPRAPWGSGGADFKRIEDYRLMTVIREQVDGLLFYPGVLAREKISGTVNARLVLNREGACDWPLTTITSSEAHLKIYILQLLKKLCRFDYGKFVRGRETTNVDLSFLFEITEGDARRGLATQEKTVGNVLLFYRGSQQSVAEWRIGPLRGVFPLPYVGLDFIWLKENWEKVVEGKDPLDEFREK